MLNRDDIKQVLDNIVAAIKKDATVKNQRIPINSFRVEVVSDYEGNIYAVDYFKYLVIGRPPGKQPPINSMEVWVAKTPDVLQSMQAIWKNITLKSAAYIIGRSIGKKGSRIWRHEKPGIDFLSAIEQSMPTLFEDLARGEAVRILTSLKSAYGTGNNTVSPI